MPSRLAQLGTHDAYRSGSVPALTQCVTSRDPEFAIDDSQGIATWNGMHAYREVGRSREALGENGGGG
ncbi:hypothetical protein GCM10027280_26690 [Micromonospora polyrhachis]